MAATGRAGGRGISVEVGAGGALRGLELTGEAIRLGRAGLATEILSLVRTATAEANERTRHELRAEFDGLSEQDLGALGIGRDEALSEQVEATTPENWRLG